MPIRTAVVALSFVVAPMVASAQEPGTAGGKGAIERLLPGPAGKSETVPFQPRFAYAYAEGSGGKRSTWIVLADKKPPASVMTGPGDRAEARRRWCEAEKAAFVAVKLDAEWKVDLYFLCPANGGVNTEMLSTINGLDSVVVKFDARDAKAVKGTLRTGNGSCPGKDGRQAYCTATGDYTFDAPLVK